MHNLKTDLEEANAFRYIVIYGKEKPRRCFTEWRNQISTHRLRSLITLDRETLCETQAPLMNRPDDECQAHGDPSTRAGLCSKGGHFEVFVETSSEECDLFECDCV